ncbi:putative acyl-CoA dehydrogenase [Actinoplanes missouriensis 431]|uniref:Putative acyl-CoA dehydrogenase n=1 Tax=Actinoplanes missouriensis (strain ATCC 14538 / DSM 43046 / CBS 188.64 / JCM 3121 / NBRC 102363 / NCIMB 12654 / NRRL B-3342 / UNCC 431) TaxID=512565 RepID=I0H287_ACTM4|nr:acyl-CoA dehydrogenase family protein [Actinoplanes missouriensis]BAL87124.1 putative acyl-CoA dehydrogenase [Actinoplanes missouriensis 431]
MFLDLTDRQRALRDELRAYLGKLLTRDQRAALARERHGRAHRDLVSRLGRDGWLGLGFPVEFGGRGLGPVEQQIFVNEAARADVPLPAVTLQTVAPTLLAHGSDEQRRRFLPPILAGDLHFAIGYTEPEAGTDLASLRTRAVRDGEFYLVSGEKTFTTGAHDADFLWLACRTAPDAPKHHGLSILIVDTADPGYSWTPLITCDGAHHVNAVHLDDVRVPVAMRVGAENEGWRLITAQLNHERVMLGPAGRLGALFDRVRDWAYATGAVTHPEVRRALSRCFAARRVNELLNAQIAGGEPNPADASATKVFASERLLSLGAELAELVARFGGDPDLLEWLDLQNQRNLVLTFGGGVNEVQREIIASAGLGLPRVPR